MRREAIFNRDGVYATIVNRNLLMHREATRTGTELLRALAENATADVPINVLDLACGGLPIAIANMMEEVPDASFSYTGIDINPDQVALANEHFRFSDNVRCARFVEGNAWDLGILELEPTYDLIFTGFNLHHGTPEEIDFLMAQIHDRLAARGIFLNHDWYRPDDDVYLRRPARNPENRDESYRLVSSEVLSTTVEPYAGDFVEFDSADAEWRLTFIRELTDSFLRHENDAQAATTLMSHMLSRDFPVSRADLSDILQRRGFLFDIVHHQNARVAIYPYLAMPFACKDEGVFHRIKNTV